MKNVEYFYPLYKTSDKHFFKFLLKAKKKRLNIIGNSNQKAEFVNCLIAAQKLNDYRAFIRLFETHLQKGRIDVHSIFNQPERS